MKKLIAALALLGSVVAFADIYETSVIISSVGPDTYADGTQVIDGEYYALCWSADEFAGIKADGSLVNPADAILKIFPAAKDGKCKLSKYILGAEDFKKGGNITLWLLDTRVFAEDGTVTVAKQESTTKVSVVNGAAEVKASVAIASAGDAGAMRAKASKQTVATALPADAPSPTIKSIKVGDVYVEIEVENTAPYIAYAVETGDKPTELVKDESKAVTGKAGGTITIYADKSEKGFFKVGRK